MIYLVLIPYTGHAPDQLACYPLLAFKFTGAGQLKKLCARRNKISEESRRIKREILPSPHNPMPVIFNFQRFFEVVAIY